MTEDGRIMSEAGGEDDGANQKVLCRFSTNLPSNFKVPETDLALPSSSTRYGLSQTVNALLKAAGVEDAHELGQEDGKQRVFDFLVEGELLRGELGRHLAKRGLSVEKTISIEYFFAVEPPEPPTTLDLPDWVGSVKVARDCGVFSGCFDGTVSVHDIAGARELRCARSAHADSVSALELVRATEAGNEGAPEVLVTASKDGTMRGWFVEPAEGKSDAKRRDGRRKKKVTKEDTGGLDLIQVFEFVGHVGGIESVGSSPAGCRFCSGGWDQKVRVWSIDEEDLAGARANASKRQRKASDGDDGEDEVGGAGLQQVETTALDGHKQCVSGVCWPEENLVCSTSWDSTVKCFDVSKGKLVSNLIRDSALFCLDAARGGGHGGSLCLAFGAADGLVATWDPREAHRSAGAPGQVALATVGSYKSHKAVVSAVRWSPNSPFHFASCDYEGLIKVWDTRSSMPLHTLESHDGKAFCLDWFEGGLVASGGSDSKVATREVRVSSAVG